MRGVFLWHARVGAQLRAQVPRRAGQVAKWRRCGGCAMKEFGFTRGDFASCPKARQWMLKRGVIRDRSGSSRWPMRLSPMDERPNKAARSYARSRARPCQRRSPEVLCMNTETQDRQSSWQALMVCWRRRGRDRTCKRVKTDKDTTGVDGLDIEQTAQLLRTLVQHPPRAGNRAVTGPVRYEG